MNDQVMVVLCCPVALQNLKGLKDGPLDGVGKLKPGGFETARLARRNKQWMSGPKPEWKIGRRIRDIKTT